MATTKQCLTSKVKKPFFNDCNNQYNNINLNQNHQSLTPVQVRDVSSESDKINNDQIDTYASQSQSDQFSWNKSKKNACLNIPYIDDSVEAESQLKVYRNLPVKGSTLSLHIAAYENSNEVANVQGKNEMEKTKNSIGKSWKDVIQFFNGSTPTNQQAYFEIPRQQSDHVGKPEIMQFKSSQKLSLPFAANFANPLLGLRRRHTVNASPPDEKGKKSVHYYH
uniref:Uncharacterized protein n=1 Tax=Panagrolaimus sp. PS1159 TaxID=55785 RepID=A0AC35GDD8_9BILA